MEKILQKPFGNEKVKISTDGKERNLIFAIESSCDESACAIIENGRKVVANVVATQIPIHQKYGGVIPEVAAREHLETINAVIAETFEQSGIKPEEITAFASTVGPGLVGCLLVGMNAAKTLSVVYNKPFIGINHLKAHVCANYIDSDLEPPFICLLVSGGHTQIIKIESYDKKILDALMAQTENSNPNIVAAAIQAMSGITHPDCLKLYISKLGEDNDTIRQNSIEAILKYGTRAISQIIAVLDNENWVMRNSAIICLQSFCEHYDIEISPVIDVLLDNLSETNPIVKCSIIKALGSAYKAYKKPDKK